MTRKKEVTTTLRTIQRYNALSPMMKIIFSSEAQLRYANDKSFMPILEDLAKADRLAHILLRFPYATIAQAEALIKREIAPLCRKDTVLNYATSALLIGDAIVYRMAYAYGKTYGSMKDFNMVHPMMTDPQTLQRQIAFLKRMNKTNFSMKNPEYSKHYKSWSVSSSVAIRFNQRRENYTLAMTNVMKEMGITFKRTPLPHIGVGRSFIKENLSRQRN